MRDTFWKLCKRPGSRAWQAHRQSNGRKHRVSTGTSVKGDAQTLVARRNRELADPAAAATETATLGVTTISYLAHVEGEAPAATLRYCTQKSNRLLAVVGSNFPLASTTVNTQDRYVEHRLANHPCPAHQPKAGRRCKKCALAVKRSTVKKELAVFRRLRCASRALRRQR